MIMPALARGQEPKKLQTGPGFRSTSRFFTERHIFVCGFTASIAYAVGFAWCFFKGQWLTLPDGSLKSIDFGYMWLSGKLASSGHVASIFDNAAFWAAQAALFGPDSRIHYFVYPPTFLLFTYPLGLMPYSPAFVIWMFTTLLLYLAAIYMIMPRPAAIVAALAPYTVAFNIFLGHNGFLTAGAMGLSLALMERRPWLSGIFLGILSYKPQFGLLFPFALLASHNWRALASATAATGILAMTAAVAFGYQGWSSFINSLVDRDPGLSEVPGYSVPLVSIFGFLRSSGVPEGMVWTVHFTLVAIVVTIICTVWARPFPHALKAAALSIGATIVTPYVLGYDLCVLSIGVAFLVKDGLSRGFLYKERAAILICCVGLMLLSGPIPAIITIVLLALVLRRAVRCAKQVPLPQPVRSFE